MFPRPGPPVHLLSMVQSFWADAAWGARRTKHVPVHYRADGFFRLGRKIGGSDIVRCAFSSFDTASQKGSAAVFFFLLLASWYTVVGRPET